MTTMYGIPLDREPLVRAFVPDGDSTVFVATSVADHVSADEAASLVHGWGVAADDHDVQVYQRVGV